MSRYAKTIVAAITALIATLKVLSDALGDGAVTTQEWVAVALAYLTAAGVYQVPNSPPPDEPADPRISERGAGDLAIVVAALVIAVAVVLAFGINDR